MIARRGVTRNDQAVTKLTRIIASPTLHTRSTNRTCEVLSDAERSWRYESGRARHAKRIGPNFLCDGSVHGRVHSCIG